MMERKGSTESSGSEKEGPKWKSLLKRIRTRITVEPLLFLYLFGGGLWWPAYDSLMYDKVCLMTISNSSMCGHVEDLLSEDENTIQSEMSHWQFYSNLIWDIPPLFMSCICGAVADHRSRKFTILVPLIGISLFMAWMIINAVYMWMHVGWILLASINTISGGWISFHVGVYSYLSSVSSEEERTSYYAFAEGFTSTAIAIALFISGLVLDKTNYVTVFTIPLILYVICTLYLVLCIKEPESAKKAKAGLDCAKTIAAFGCVLKKRPGKGRRMILILLASTATFMFANGVHHLNFLHLKHHPLAWSQTMYGYWRGVYSGVGAITIFALVPWLKRKARVQDTQLLMISFAASAVSKIIFGLSTKTWMAFIVPFTDAGHVLGMTCKRSIISKLVDENEVGQAIAILTSMYSIMNLISSAIYNQLYPFTLHISSGLIFHVGAALTIIPILLMWWLQRELATQQYGHLSEELDTNNDTRSLVITEMESEVQPVQMENIHDFQIISQEKGNKDPMENIVL